MKKEAKLLLERATDSLVLSIEHFNRPWDRGRMEATIILLDRSFELLLKAAILHKNGRIRESRAKETIGFDKCVRKCLSEKEVECLDDDQALTLQIINSLRDAAQHHLLDVSEQQLYMYAQAGVTLFDSILQDVFEQRLREHLPARVLPVSTEPPTDIALLIDKEFAQIKKLVAPKSRKRLEARARLRSLAVIEAALSGQRSQPAKAELDRMIREIQKGKKWTDLFPGVATLRLDTKGSGLSFSIRLTKRDGEAIHLVKEGTPGATTVAIKRVNELGFYSMGLNQVAKKCGLTPPKALAMVRHLGLQDDEDFFKVIKVGSQEHKRYSQKAVERIKEELAQVDLAEVWEEHRPKRAGG